MRTTRKVALAGAVAALSAGCLFGATRGKRPNADRPAGQAQPAGIRPARAKSGVSYDRDGRTTLIHAAPAPLAPRRPEGPNNPARPFWDVGVDWSLQLDAQTQAHYQKMANHFSTVNAVPNDRLNYYSAVNDPPNWAIQSWSGLVTSVVANGDGSYQVTVTADPRLAQSSTLMLMSDYSEIYHVDANNNWTYVGFLDPNHWAGTIPGLANL